jgi:hypothetical protein
LLAKPFKTVPQGALIPLSYSLFAITSSVDKLESHFVTASLLGADVGLPGSDDPIALATPNSPARLWMPRRVVFTKAALDEAHGQKILTRARDSNCLSKFCPPTG